MTNLIIIPGSPALVRELAPRDEAGAQLLSIARRAVTAARDVGLTKVRIVSVRKDRDYTAHTGTFAAWGAPDVGVGGGNYLPELVARYVLQPIEGLTVVDVRDAFTPLHPEHLTLAVVDGSAGLTARAPLALLEHGAWAHQWCQDFLRGSAAAPHEAINVERLTEAGVIDTEIWEKLAELRPTHRTLLAADDSLGVGRYVATWDLPGGAA